jgi:alanyl-tRNA synthetase
MMTSGEIRQQFMDFFASKTHAIVPSAPIVVKNDPTLMFTNAGMNQFKDFFLGNKTSPHKRIADTQKCLRVSGKHNDLEEVGVDTYHHTMFEMLGNWSFGDYFKKEAIAWSWELLTKVYRLPVERLYVTIFEGDEKEGLPKDDEAFNEWKKWVAEDRILMGNKKDNFWEMGDSGPCGPCTEIHFDTRPEAKNDGHALVNNDDTGMVMEIWNNVFIQFNRLKDGTLETLPARHVDTGMGLERLVRVLQGKTSNYDTDVFTGTINAIGKIVNREYADLQKEERSQNPQGSKGAIAFRVIADHIRAISFTIADGQLPSNTGAGYVIRRILRRAVRYYYSYLDYKQPLLHQLVPVLAAQFENVFPELHKQLDFVSKVVKEEEEAFLRTLEKGLKRIDEIISSSAAQSTIQGKEVFELYDTYGFPIDLTRLIAAENKLTVDEAGFEKEMLQQKQRSRAATAVDTEDWVVLDDFARNEFIGYQELESETKIVKYRKVKSKGKESYQLVLEVTPFYAESGGQAGDRGELIIENEKIITHDTKKENDLIIHFTDNIPSNLSGKVIARVDRNKRKNTTLHHSATHLLHAALRSVLGKHVSQKGSLVNEEHLRFDFSHFAKVSKEDTERIEAIVNEKIRENIPVVIKELPKDEAMNMGAMALFGEKYGEVVRVVIMDPSYSVELCGGTHAGHTGELGFFKITHETAVAAGVRRMEALCGQEAESFLREQLQQLDGVKEYFKNPKDLIKSVEQLQDENLQLKKQLESFENRMLVSVRNELLLKKETIDGISFIGEIIEVNNADALKKLCHDLKNNLTQYLVVLCANIGGKPFVAIGIDETLASHKNLDAGKLIKETVAPLIKGGGGGQKTLATAGGQDASNLEQVIKEVRSRIQKD